MKKVAIFLLALLMSTSAMASIIKKPPAKPVDIPYSELVCSESDKKIIGEIITMVAENNWLDLFLNRTEIYERGTHIDHVHPMKFVTTIINHPDLKASLQKLWPDSFKRAGFLDGLI